MLLLTRPPAPANLTDYSTATEARASSCQSPENGNGTEDFHDHALPEFRRDAGVVQNIQNGDEGKADDAARFPYFVFSDAISQIFERSSVEGKACRKRSRPEDPSIPRTGGKAACKIPCRTRKTVPGNEEQRSEIAAGLVHHVSRRVAEAQEAHIIDRQSEQATEKEVSSFMHDDAGKVSSRDHGTRNNKKHYSPISFSLALYRRGIGDRIRICR